MQIYTLHFRKNKLLNVLSASYVLSIKNQVLGSKCTVTIIWMVKF